MTKFVVLNWSFCLFSYTLLYTLFLFQLRFFFLIFFKICKDFSWIYRVAHLSFARDFYARDFLKTC